MSIEMTTSPCGSFLKKDIVLRSQTIQLLSSELETKMLYGRETEIARMVDVCPLKISHCEKLEGSSPVGLTDLYTLITPSLPPVAKIFPF